MAVIKGHNNLKRNQKKKVNKKQKKPKNTAAKRKIEKKPSQTTKDSTAKIEYRHRRDNKGSQAPKPSNKKRATTTAAPPKKEKTFSMQKGKLPTNGNSGTKKLASIPTYGNPNTKNSTFGDFRLAEKKSNPKQKEEDLTAFYTKVAPFTPKANIDNTVKKIIAKQEKKEQERETRNENNLSKLKAVGDAQIQGFKNIGNGVEAVSDSLGYLMQKGAKGVNTSVKGFVDELAIKATLATQQQISMMPKELQDEIAKNSGYSNIEEAKKDMENDAINLTSKLWFDEADKALSQENENIPHAVKAASKYVEAAGQMVPAIIAGRLNPKLSLPTMGVSYAGLAAQEAYKNGATLPEADSVGTIKGAKSIIIEKATSGIPGLGKGVLDKYIKIGSGNKLVDFVKRITGGGLKAGFDIGTDPLVDRAVYDKDAPFATWDDYVEAFKSGAITSAGMKATATAAQKMNKIANERNGNNLAQKGSPIANSGIIPGMGDFRKTENEQNANKNNIIPANLLPSVNTIITSLNQGNKPNKAHYQALLPSEANTANRQTFQQETGITLPNNIQGTKKALQAYAERKAKNPIFEKTNDTKSADFSLNTLNHTINRPDLNPEQEVQVKQLADQITKTTGVKTTVNNNLPTNVDGLFDHKTGTIELNGHSDVDTLKVYTSTHELTHAMKQKDADSYHQFMQVASESEAFNSLVAEKGGLEEWSADLVATYRTNGKELDSQGIADEMLAHFVGSDRFSSESFVNRLYSEKPKVIQTIINFVRDLRVRLTGTKQEKNLLAMQRQLESMIKTKGEIALETKNANVNEYISKNFLNDFKA